METMNEKKSNVNVDETKQKFTNVCGMIKNGITDFWSKNGRVIKAGTKCLLVGSLYGYIKGYMAGSSSVFPLAERLSDKIPDMPWDIDVMEVLKGMTKSDVYELVDQMIENGDLVDE